MADCTFEIAKPTLFTQVLVVSAKSKTDVRVPCLFAFLPSKETVVYHQVFKLLADCGLKGPDRFHSDFEKALIKGFTQVFPDTDIVGCDTHWKRCLTTNLRKCGLSEVVKESVAMQTIHRYLWALSLVPCSDVVKIWEEFVANEFDRMEENGDFADFIDEIYEFMNYYERAWVGELNRRTFVRRKPTFPLAWWNKHEQVRNSSDTTSNSIEGYNNALNYSISRKANIWTLIDLMRTEEAGLQRKLHEAAIGTVTSPKNRDKSRQQRQSELQSLVANYENVDMKTYMYSLVQFYNCY